MLNLNFCRSPAIKTFSFSSQIYYLSKKQLNLKSNMMPKDQAGFRVINCCAFGFETSSGLIFCPLTTYFSS